MRQFYFSLITVFIYSLSIWDVQAQSTQINLRFDSTLLKDILPVFEEQVDQAVYYNVNDFDTIKYNISIRSSSVKQALTELLAPTQLKFTIYKNQIFITKDVPLLTSLPANFFKVEEYELEDEEDELPDFMKMNDQETGQKGIESRLFIIGKSNGNGLNGNANVAGNIRDMDTGEPVVGAVVYIEEPRIGVATDAYGYYSISLPKGRHELKVNSVGMKPTKRQILLNADGKLDIEIKEDVIPLREIIVESEKDLNITSLNMGVEKLDIKTMKNVPSAFGETDILRIALTLPGVQTVGESSTGLNVRGGTTDQNLILYNDATIYNPSHLFGFFSAFNPDVLKNVELYKSGIPAHLGGRLSSVLEITTKEGNKRKFTGSGGIGLLTSKLAFEIPVIKDKLSVSISGRSTYSDWLLKKVPDESIKNSKASFYDVNGHINYEVNEKNNIYITGYHSDDRFKLNSDTTYQYNNDAITFKWKHVFANKFYGVLTAGYSGYNYKVSSDENPVNAFDLSYNLQQKNAKLDFNYFPNSTHNFDFGICTNLYDIDPGNLDPKGEESLMVPLHIQKEKGLESAVYVGDKIELNSRMSLYVGLRYSLFNALGPRDVIYYAEGHPKDPNNITDTVSYSNEIINTYHGPEYRASLRYLLGNDASLKLSFNRMRQYIHMLSNTTSISPTDTWKLSDPNIKPQIGDQFALGYYKNFRASAVETSIEAYYKTSQNILDYKSGAELILNENIEGDVLGTEGKAYGVEVLVKKTKGKINGWLSYTYSRSFLRTNSENLLETINDGEYYPSNYDKPHDFTMIGNYKFNRRFNIGLNVTYSTGRPITLPLTRYEYNGSGRVHYSDRNQYRIPDYFRIDLSMNIEGNHKIRKLAHSSWTIGVYNLTGRKNAYSIFFATENGKIKGYKMSIFGNPIPTITYNFKF